MIQSSKKKLNFIFETANSIHIVFACVVMVIIIRLYLLPGYSYSPDSFDYFSLSKTFFTGDGFYKINTIRSYLNIENSSAFPLLYPTCLSLVSLLFGENYLNAAYFNVFLMTLTYIILFKLAILIQNKKPLGAFFSLTLILFPGYIQEVLSGRSIPLSLMLLSLCILFYSRNKVYLSFFVLGLACISRFDILPIALFAALYVSYDKKNITILITLFFGMLPWIIYSLIYLDSIWASDNSWIALSSTPAFVTDFPAAASSTLFSNPLEWIVRVTKNFLKGIFYFGLAGSTNFLLVTLAVYFLIKKTYLKVTGINYLLLFLILNAILSPVYLSGYFDIRYFYFAIFIISLFLFSLEAKNIRNVHIAVLILPTLALPSWYIFSPFLNFNINISKIEKRYEDIDLLKSLHSTQMQTTFFIKDRENSLPVGPMYGALTGNKIAYKPRNLSEEKLQAFNELIGPNVDIILDNY
jgi:hypothetical protein